MSVHKASDVSPTDEANCRWLNVAQAAAYLHVCQNVIRNLIHQGELHAARIGNQFRIERCDLDRLMLRRKRRVAPYRRGSRPWVAERHERNRKRGSR